jgi:hypothetical protein
MKAYGNPHLLAISDSLSKGEKLEKIINQKTLPTPA